MKTNYEALFTACIEISGKWISLSNAIIAIAVINTLWNTAFLLLGYPENIAFQSLSNRLFLVSFGCIGIAFVLGMIAIFAMRKVDAIDIEHPARGAFFNYVFCLQRESSKTKQTCGYNR